MVKPKATSKKQQKRGLDFKKIRRKIGRKLPPPNNATNTEIKSKAIILPEQSVASDKAGLAVSKKGLTLKELLSQTSHHNQKVRRDALIGIRDIFLKYPAELKLHKLAVIEKLRERISDDDKIVRETLYQLLKSVIFPGCKEGNLGPFISLVMAYIFNAMTHLAIDVRLMAFKFFDLVIQHYPSTFSLYAEKILQNYEDILRKNQFYLQDKGKLKGSLAGLVRCLSLLPCNRRGNDTSSENDVAAQVILHAFEPDAPKSPAGVSDISKKLKDLMPVLVGCFIDFIPLVHMEPLLDAQSFDCMLSILQCIELGARFLNYGSHSSQEELELQGSAPCYKGSGLVISGQTVMPVLLKKLFDVFPFNPKHHISEKEDDKYFILNVVITEIFLRLSGWSCPSIALLEKFLEFIESALSEKVCSRTHTGKGFFEKHLLSLIHFIPKLILQVAGNWRSRILQAFTKVFKDCTPESSLKLACLSAVEEMLVSKQGLLHLDATDSEILDYQIAWIRELPLLLIQLDEKHQSCSKIVLRLLLRLGQCAPLNSSFSQEYDNIQYSFLEFYCTFQDERNVCYGPFTRLSRDSQELSISCLYYFSFLDPLLLRSLASCCLCHDLKPIILFRIIEVLQAAYKAGRIQIADHISFLVTLISRFKVFPEHTCTVVESDEISNRGTFKRVTTTVCSCLSQMGDDYLVLHILEQAVLEQLSLQLPVDNNQALLRMLITLDSKPTRLSEQSIVHLSNLLPQYLIDVVSRVPEDDNESTIFFQTRASRYYLLPCFVFFYRSEKLLHLLLNVMGSLVAEMSSSLFSCTKMQCPTEYTSRITALVSSVLWMHKDVKLQQSLSSCKAAIDFILQKISTIQSHEEVNIAMEERHKIQCAFDRLNKVSAGC